VTNAAISLVKHTPEYRAVRKQLSGPAASDVWLEKGRWFVVFEMSTDNAIAVFTFEHPNGAVEVRKLMANIEQGFTVIELSDISSPDPERI